MKIKIGYFYPKELNLYGDTGNVEILVRRAQKRKIQTEVVEINSETKVTAQLMDSLDIVFMGGGPDSGQKTMYTDLINNKKSFLKNHIEKKKPALFICGSYQLLGHYYKAASGDILDGLGIFDIYTQHFGHTHTRSVGNIVCSINETLLNDKVFSLNNKIGFTLVGFENHGGQTFLGKNIKPLGKVLFGYGNNQEDLSEGVLYKNSIGTYMHGPFLSKNPHIADYLIAKSLKLDKLKSIDDSLIINAHTALVNRLT